MPEERIFPLRGISLDTANEYMKPDVARFIKNLVYADTSQTGGAKGAQMGMFKTLESVRAYDDNFTLPVGPRQYAGGFTTEQTNEVLFFIQNSNGNHGLYRIDGENRVVQKVYERPCLNLQLAPQYFIHEGGAWLEVFYFTDPNTGLPRHRSYFMWTDGFNDLRFLCIEDSIATNGFDDFQFPYFSGDYDRCELINAGVPTPFLFSNDAYYCIKVTPVTNDEPTKPNFLRFKTWQFRIRMIDVYGRPSEYDMISDIYVPEGGCLENSNGVPRCLDLTFASGNPLIDKVEIAFRNCNDQEWFTDTTLFLYQGSCLGDWWLRPKNPAINFNAETNEITYRFCKDKECDPIAVALTNRTQNPLPRICQTIAKIGKEIGTGFNKDGFNQFGNEIMDQLSIVIETPEQVDELRNITMWFEVFNPHGWGNQAIYRQRLSPTEPEFYGFGEFNNFGGTGFGRQFAFKDYKQYFKNPIQKGFIANIAGTNILSQSTQYEYFNGVFTEVTDFAFNNFAPGRLYLQKVVFNSLKPGTYVIRLLSHQADLSVISVEDARKTSTYTAGTYGFDINNPIPINHAFIVSEAKELVVDVCNGDYDTLQDNKIIVVFDLAFPSSVIEQGYVYNTNLSGQSQIPIELLKFEGGDAISKSNFTDHNGFFFTASATKKYKFRIYGYCDCVLKQLFNEGQAPVFGPNGENAFNETIYYASESTGCVDYESQQCTYIKITGKVLLCGTTIGVPGVSVVLARGSTAITDSNGIFTIIAHDDSTLATGTRTDKLYFIASGCSFTACDGGCIAAINIAAFPVCVSCLPRVVNVIDTFITFEEQRGLLSGGQYGVAIWGGHDWLGRHTFSQTRDGLYFTMPTLIDTQTFAPSTVKLIIPPTATFPLEFKKLTIGITKELSLATYIQWVVDKVVFIDNSGDENTAAPTQIKIYYASLIEYNKQNNFNTTTGWGFIVQATPQINYTSDYVEFYLNGDGTFFPTLIRAIIKYDQTGQYFLIDYDSALKDLKQYALIRLARPAECIDKGVFFELCGSIDLVNGKAQQTEIVLNAFDTYYVFRQIPIPIPAVDPDETINLPQEFGFPFEHHAPSDLWGDGCQNIGRVNTKNPYECEIIKPNEIALSGALSVNGQLNFLNFFDDAQKRNFDTWNFGGFVCIKPFTGGIRGICQYNCVTIGFNDNVMRVGKNNEIIVPSADAKFGNPQLKIGNDYGCSLFDKNTIRQREGFIQFLDSSKAYLIQDNFDESQPVSANIIDSWLRPKVKFINEWNLTHKNKKFFHGTIDPAANAYLLSDFTIGSDSYFNDKRDYDISVHETMIFDIYNKVFRGTPCYTPQGYNYLDSNVLEKQLFSFVDGLPYFHYTTSPIKTYGTVYGRPAERVIRFVVVLDAMSKKQPLAMAVYCVQSLYFADKIITDSFQESRILLSQWKKGDYFSSAPFLCNLLTPADPNLVKQTGVNRLTDGDRLQGSIVDIRLVGDPSKDQIYSELLGQTVSVFKIMQSG